MTTLPVSLQPLARAGLLRPLSALPARPAALATGFPALDTLLGGGLPGRALTVLAGGPSSGAEALALRVAACVNRTGQLVAWLDAVRGFDPAAARRSGLDAARLLLARPETPADALSIAYDLLSEGSARLLILDAGEWTPPDASLRLLLNAVARSEAALVWLSESAVPLAGARLRLSMTRLGWETAGGDAVALRAQVAVEAGRGIVGRSVELTLAVDEVGPCWSAS